MCFVFFEIVLLKQKNVISMPLEDESVHKTQGTSNCFAFFFFFESSLVVFMQVPSVSEHATHPPPSVLLCL